VALGLFCSSLPQGYAAAPCARVLGQTLAMRQRGRQRIFEVAQFLFDVLEEGGLSPTGPGIRAVQKVRLMHAGIRQRMIHAPGWSQADGIPINQEDMAATVLPFSVVSLDVFEKLGRAVSASEEQAWLHVWNVVGHLLGVQDQLLPRSRSDGEAFLEAFRRRHWAASSEGKELTKMLVEIMQDYYPPLLACIPGALIRHFAGTRCADLLDLPRTDWKPLLGIMEILLCSGKDGAGLDDLSRHVISCLTGSLSGQFEGESWTDLLWQAVAALGPLLLASGNGETGIGPLLRRASHRLMRGLVQAHRDVLLTEGSCRQPTLLRTAIGASMAGA
jgi:hypothetical protein